MAWNDSCGAPADFRADMNTSGSSSVLISVADLGFVKEGFQVWAKPTSPRKRPKLGGSGGMPPQKIFANTDASRCILVHSGLYDSDIFYTLMLTAIPRLSVIKRHANAATPTMITS